MSLKSSTVQLLAFLLMCVIWGLTFIAIKIGVEAVPPTLFAGVRFVVAGSILLVIQGRSIRWSEIVSSWREIGAATVLMIAVGYGLIFWGMQHTSSGVAAIVNLALFPVCIYFLTVLLGQEKASVRKLVGLAVGVAGLTLLFSSPSVELGGYEILGAAAIALATLSYAVGAIISRPILQNIGPIAFSGTTMFVGGWMLMLAAVVQDPASLASVTEILGPKVLISMSFLVVFGSIGAYTIYLWLVQVWGPFRAGLYSFVSPIVAVTSGALMLGEFLNTHQIAACVLLMIAAALASAPGGLAAHGGWLFSWLGVRGGNAEDRLGEPTIERTD